jgi:hypothetical protein
MNRGQVIDPEWVQSGDQGRSVRYVPPGFGRALVDTALGTIPAPLLLNVRAAVHVIKDDPEPSLPSLPREVPLAVQIRKTMARISEPATIQEITHHSKLKQSQVAAYLYRVGAEVLVSGIHGQKRFTLSSLGLQMVQGESSR